MGGMAIWVAIQVKRNYVDGRASGVGRVARAKRRVFAEVSTLQRYVDLENSYDQLGDEQKKIVADLAKRYNYKGSSRSTKTVAEQYYNNLKRQYNAISGIGSTTLPFTPYVIRNGRGDVIMQYNDYGTESDIFRDAMRDYSDDNYRDAYAMTVWYIANGGKLVWSKKPPFYGVKEMIFATGGDAKEERKLRRSYLSKDGYTPDQLAHTIWESWNMEGDTKDILDDVCSALLSIQSIAEAQKIVVDYYMNKHQNRIIDKEEADYRQGQFDNMDHFQPENDAPF